MKYLLSEDTRKEIEELIRRGNDNVRELASKSAPVRPSAPNVRYVKYSAGANSVVSLYDGTTWTDLDGLVTLTLPDGTTTGLTSGTRYLALQCGNSTFVTMPTTSGGSSAVILDKEQFALPLSNSSTTLTSVGWPAMITQGTPTVAYDGTQRGMFIQYTSAGTPGSVCGVSNIGFPIVDTSWNPIFVCVMEFFNAADFNSAANIAWCGLVNTNIGAAVTLNNQHGSAFVTHGSGLWHIAFNNAAVTAPAWQATGVTIAAKTRYVLKIDMSNFVSTGFVDYSINGTLVLHTNNASLPPGGTGNGMSPQCSNGVVTTGGCTISVSLLKLYSAG